MTLPDPPADISEEAADFWREHLREMDEHELEPDARELAILRGAVRHMTIAGRLEAAIAETENLLVPGSRNNQRVSPFVSELNKYRAEIRTALVAIKPPAPAKPRRTHWNNA
ncbi:hypothetical protein [uncultured Pseudokineococcus sp.]|uniref:hypothetical protein n=1 Tax=uncultured Pseudokineococcus sp. TaxID=1642928 RepID=UPI00262D8024|nr:hypothetical protein [uncultured Pseudokineococcus sp.]